MALQDWSLKPLVRRKLLFLLGRCIAGLFFLFYWPLAFTHCLRQQTLNRNQSTVQEPLNSPNCTGADCSWEPHITANTGGGGDGAGGRKCFRQLPAITVPRASPAPAVCLQTRCRKCSAAARQLQSLAAGQGRRLAAHTSEDTRLRSPKLAQGPCSDGTGLRSLQKFTKTE